jgi:hypothetical protein
MFDNGLSRQQRGGRHVGDVDYNGFAEKTCAFYSAEGYGDLCVRSRATIRSIVNEICPEIAAADRVLVVDLIESWNTDQAIIPVAG